MNPSGQNVNSKNKLKGSLFERRPNGIVLTLDLNWIVLTKCDEDRQYTDQEVHLLQGFIHCNSSHDFIVTFWIELP